MSNLNNISVFSNKLCFTIFLFNKLFLKSRKQDNIQIVGYRYSILM